jgi:hypothetical protein
VLKPKADELSEVLQKDGEAVVMHLPGRRNRHRNMEIKIACRIGPQAHATP